MNAPVLRALAEDANSERRKLILDAAERSFTRSGFHRTTMQDVAAEAGMSPGNLYRYFPSKDALVAGLCERDRADLANEFVEMRERSDFLPAFRELGRRHFEDAARGKARLCLEIWAEATRNPAIATLQCEFEHGFDEQLTKTFEAAKQAGAIHPDVDIRAVASIISKLGNGLFVRRAVAADFDPEREIGEVFAVIGALLKGAVKFPAPELGTGEHAMMFSRILAAIVIVAATLWIGSGVLGRTETPTQSADAKAAPVAAPLFKVAVINAHVEGHSRSLVLSGRTEADDRASAVARTVGSILQLNVKRGDVVKEGDVIATLSDEAREAQVTQAEALVQQRQADLEAKSQLIKRGIVAANDKNQLEADLRSAEAGLALAKAEYERGLVRAPISGVVSNAPMTTGQSMQANGMVAEIIALDPMLAVAEMAERQLGEVKVGDPAVARLVTGQSAEGKVRYISPTASEGTRTYRVEVVLPNADHAIADGVTAEVEFKLAPVQSARIPRSALTFSAEGISAFASSARMASSPRSRSKSSRTGATKSGSADRRTARKSSCRARTL